MLEASTHANPVRRAARRAADFVDLYLHCLTGALTAAAPKARGRLLDVGCGDRRFEPLFAPFVTSYTGIEHDAVFNSTEASRRANGPDLYYDGKVLPFDANTFDTVISTDVLEHTPDPASLIAEMARVMKPGGTGILTAPFAFRLHEEPYDYFRYTPHGLRFLFERAGLRVVEIRSFGGLFRVVGHKLNSYLAFRVARLQGLGRLLGKMGHETSGNDVRPRVLALPAVLPSMATIAAIARLLDHIAPEPTESLGYLVIAEKPVPAEA